VLIAIPSDAPGGLDAPIADHFGHCAAFTLVNIDDGKIGEVEVMQNGGHEQGGCMAPVTLLKERAVEALVSGGMGMRPLSGFQQVGIKVLFKEEAETVREAVQLIIDGTAREFGEAQTCGGGEGHCGGHGHHHHHHEEIVREPIEGKADVQDGRVIGIEYKLYDKQGELIDSSEDVGPMRYLHGQTEIPPGLEQALTGLEVGAQLKIELKAADAYGERDDTKIIEVPRNELPPHAEPGQQVTGEGEDGGMVVFTIVEMSDESVKLDPNHPLSGEDLTFDVTVVSVEKATAEELEHGHVH